MKKSEELVNIARTINSAKDALVYANNRLKDLEDNEGSIMGQGILRNIQKYTDFIMIQAQIALEEEIEEEKKQKEE